MSSEVNFDELLNKGDEIIQKLIDTGGRSWCLSVPARPNEDPDLVLSKIISEARKERLAHQDTKAQLEALEDWVERRFELVGKSVIQPQRGIVNGGFDAPFKAITNSQARRKANPCPCPEP